MGLSVGSPLVVLLLLAQRLPVIAAVDRRVPHSSPRLATSLPRASAGDDSLLPLLGVDVASAVTSSALLSPFVTVIDKSIVMAAAGSKTLGTAVADTVVTAAKNPVKFFTSLEYLYICGVYATTYTAANAIETIWERRQQPTAIPKLVGTTVVNINTCVAKDASFAKMFGAKAPTAVPKRTLSLFSTRDGLTVFASFIFPPQMAAALQKMGVDSGTSLNLSQILAPVAVQLVSTPLHLLGLDFYNRAPGTLTGAAGELPRWRVCFKNYGAVAGARMLRVLPAFGIGGIGNRVLRTKGRAVVRSLSDRS